MTMIHSKVTIASVVALLWAVGCTGEISAPQPASQGTPNVPALASSEADSIQTQVNNPTHYTAIKIERIGNSETTGLFDVPDVGKVSVVMTTNDKHQATGLFSLNGVPYYHASFGGADPEPIQPMSVLGMSEPLGETLIVATAEIWDDLTVGLAPQTGANGAQLEKSYDCGIETVDCPPDCESLIFHSKCTICFKFKCKISG
jgi:hypothetical protein